MVGGGGGREEGEQNGVSGGRVGVKEEEGWERETTLSPVGGYT